MRIKTVLRVLSLVCLVVCTGMILPLMLALYDGSNDALGFFISMLIGAGFSLTVLKITGRTDNNYMGIREGVGVTGFSWIIASLIGALPYWISGNAASYTDAFFETMSGFTTTGATIFREIESLPRGILLWRSLTHLMGGMGIIVLSLAVLPFLGVSGMAMYKAEVPGVTAGKVTPRLHQTALRLWGVYMLLIFLEMILLMLGGMSLFDAFCHSCSTIATGGFSTKNNSIAYFSSAYIEWVVIIFMFLSGVNFSLYFMIPQRKFKEIFADEELRCYAKIVIFSALVMTMVMYFTGYFKDFMFALRNTLFSVVSVMTTTGFITLDFDLWPDFCRFLLVVIMFIGASGGSTGGGFKVSRVQIIYRHMMSEVSRLLHPKAVINPRMDGKAIPQSTLNSSTAFLILYLLLFLAGTLITLLFGVDLVSAVSGVITCISNVGPALNKLGSVEHFGNLPCVIKWLFSFLMLAGRLELFAVFLLFVPETYRK
ncbi:MAG: TrkH family potassium uptake protein [Synergistaceae bacterium]|nr:TrkH family potassium uptake protein [Synergistaceae bacterium]